MYFIMLYLLSFMYKCEIGDLCCIMFEKKLYIEEYVRFVQNNVDFEEFYGVLNNLERMEGCQW